MYKTPHIEWNLYLQAKQMWNEIPLLTWLQYPLYCSCLISCYSFTLGCYFCNRSFSTTTSVLPRNHSATKQAQHFSQLPYRVFVVLGTWEINILLTPSDGAIEQVLLCKFLSVYKVKILKETWAHPRTDQIKMLSKSEKVHTSLSDRCLVSFRFRRRGFLHDSSVESQFILSFLWNTSQAGGLRLPELISASIFSHSVEATKPPQPRMFKVVLHGLHIKPVITNLYSNTTMVVNIIIYKLLNAYWTKLNCYKTNTKKLCKICKEATHEGCNSTTNILKTGNNKLNMYILRKS